jgi:hypothetical protein
MSPAEVTLISALVTVSVLFFHLLLRGPISRVVERARPGPILLTLGLAAVAALAAAAAFPWHREGPIPTFLAAAAVIVVSLLAGAVARWLREVNPWSVLLTLGLAVLAAVGAMAMFEWRWYGPIPPVLAAGAVIAVAVFHAPIARLLRQVRTWHLAVLGLLVFFMVGATAQYPEPAIVIGLLEAVVLFAWAWSRQFRYLMALGEDAFPGRFDKPIWALLMIVLPPLGLPTFWAYRRAHWPEPKPERVAAVHELA